MLRHQSARTLGLPPLLRHTTDILISLDTEYQAERNPRVQCHTKPALGLSNAPVLVPARNAERNKVLSYQFQAVDTRTGEKARALILANGKRQALHQLVRHICEQLGLPLTALRPQSQNAEPLRIMIAWHWGSAEVGLLSDRKALMAHKEVKALSGAVITLEPFLYHIPLGDGHSCGRVLVTFRDTSRLADANTSLEEIGRDIGIPKVDIAPWTKDAMEKLLQENPRLYERYAMTDVDIVAEWICAMAKTQGEVLHLNQLAPTTGTASASGLQAFLGKDFPHVFCVYYHKGEQLWKPTRLRAGYEAFPTQAFLGGMNQSYHLGRVKGTIVDLDLCGAYSGAMGILPGIDWDVAPTCDIRNPWELTDLMSFAAITFRFPPDTPFPCLPVHTDHGLVYPLSCDEVRYVTGPEIHEALLMGASIKVHGAHKFQTNGLLLAGYLKPLCDLRAQYPNSKDIRNKAAKLAINSLYGKFGQGLANRSTNKELYTEEQIEEGRHTPRSPITLPHAAATITGIVRAVLNVLVNEAAKLGTVLSATTDGLMLCLPDGMDTEHTISTLMRACEQYPSVQLLMQGRENLGLPAHDWLENKHPGGTEASTLKTRMNWIGNAAGTVHEAKVGFKKRQDDADYVAYTDLERIANDQARSYYTEARLNKITDVCPEAGQRATAEDITSFYVCKEVNVCPDWKRRFATDGTSKPFQSMQEFWHYRRVVDLKADQAWPDIVEYLLDERCPSLDTQAIRRDVLHRIATGIPGFRLPRGTTYKDACKTLGINTKALSKLRRERSTLKPLPRTHPEALRITQLLHLW